MSNRADLLFKQHYISSERISEKKSQEKERADIAFCEELVDRSYDSLKKAFEHGRTENYFRVLRMCNKRIEKR